MKKHLMILLFAWFCITSAMEESGGLTDSWVTVPEAERQQEPSSGYASAEGDQALIHHISLHDEWFDLVLSGKKIYEGRRTTESIKKMSVGDILRISRYKKENLGSIDVEITGILTFQTFRDALTAVPINEILPVSGITVERGVEIYYRYVTEKTQLKDGITMIKMSKICQSQT